MSAGALGKKVDKLFERYAVEGSPGCAVAVMNEGEIIFKRGYGLANVEHKIPNTPATVYNIGSEAKQFTAMGILMLAAEGKLALDDDIRQHLPESPDFGQTISVRHLVHHTSGVRCSFPPLLMLGGWLEPDLTTNDDVYRLFLAQRKLNFTPGEEFSYANMGYIVLARIVERVSGQPFAAFCRARIFEPLGMSSTVIQDNPWLIVDNRAQSYWMDDNGRLFNAFLADGVCGPTNVYSSVEDLARWDANFTNGQVGGTELIAKMHQPGRLNDGTELDYAFGLMVGHSHRGLRLVEHGGGHGGYVSALVRFPDVSLSVILICNVFNWHARHDALQVADVFLDSMGYQESARAKTATAASDRPVIEPNKGQLRALAGVYFDAKRVALREASLKDGKLQLSGLDLQPLSETRFVFAESPDVQVVFGIDADDQPTQMQIISNMSDNTYQRVETVTPTPAELKAYEGQYFCPELQVYWNITLDGDHLTVKRQRYQSTKLTPVLADGFKDDWLPIVGFPFSYFLLFDRDARGAIVGFGASDDRMRDLKFNRQEVLSTAVKSN